MVLRSSSMVPGLKRQNSDLRNQGSNQFRNKVTCATPILRLKLLVLLMCSSLVVEPLTLWPHLNDPHPILPPVSYFVLLLPSNFSTCSCVNSKNCQPLELEAKLPG